MIRQLYFPVRLGDQMIWLDHYAGRLPDHGYEPGGAEEKFQDIKSAIKGQYGLNSVPWGVVKGMKW